MTFKQFIQFNQENKLFRDDVVITFYHYDGSVEVTILNFDYKANMGNALTYFNDETLNKEIMTIIPQNDLFIDGLEFVFKEV